MQECSKDSQFGYCMSKAALNMASCIVLNGIRKAGGSVMNLHPGWMQSVIENPRIQTLRLWNRPGRGR